jgi:hypothetical protein
MLTPCLIPPIVRNFGRVFYFLFSNDRRFYGGFFFLVGPGSR